MALHNPYDPLTNRLDYEKKKSIDYQVYLDQSGGRLTRQNYTLERFLQETNWEKANPRPKTAIEKTATYVGNTVRQFFAPPTAEAIQEQQAYQEYIQAAVTNRQTPVSASQWKKTYAVDTSKPLKIPVTTKTDSQQTVSTATGPEKPGLVQQHSPTETSGISSWRYPFWGPKPKSLLSNTRINTAVPVTVSKGKSAGTTVVATGTSAATTETVAATGTGTTTKPDVYPLDTNPWRTPEKATATEPPKELSDIDKAIQEYKQQLDDANRRANQVEGAKGLFNIASLVSAYNLNAPQDLQAPVLRSPHMLSPGKYLREAQSAMLDKQVNTSNRILAETGRSDAIVGNTANAMESVNTIAVESVGKDLETANLQVKADTEVANQNMLARTEAHNKNIQRNMEYNLMKGKAVTDSLNAMAEQGTNYANRMGQTVYGKWQADLEALKTKMMQDYYFQASLALGRNAHTDVSETVPVAEPTTE